MNPDSDVIWDVFISHASEDKSSFVEPLAQAIENSGYAVWYDKFTLKWGDSLRQSIERGLANSRYGIVVLSKAFFRKRWPQQELDGLFEKETHGENTILPIWHGVTESEVRKHCPIVSGRLAIDSKEGIENILFALKEVIGKPHRKPIKRQIEKLGEVETLPELENLAKNLWWLSENNPNRLDISKKLGEVFKELSNEIQQSNLVAPRSTERKARPIQEGASRYDDYVALGSTGRTEDIDFLMNELVSNNREASTKLIDFSLGLVNKRDGIRRMEHYLFNGNQTQRNYAALYFKRRGNNALLENALKKGKIDKVQARAK